MSRPSAGSVQVQTSWGVFEQAAASGGGSGVERGGASVLCDFIPHPEVLSSVHFCQITMLLFSWPSPTRDLWFQNLKWNKDMFNMYDGDIGSYLLLSPLEAGWQWDVWVQCCVIWLKSLTVLQLWHMEDSDKELWFRAADAEPWLFALPVGLNVGPTGDYDPGVHPAALPVLFCLCCLFSPSPTWLWLTGFLLSL